MADSTGTFIHLSQHECRELLETQTVGRLAFVDASGQKLVPVNFVVHAGDIVFRTMADTVTAALADGHADVAFGVDHVDGTFQQGWNVTVTGSTSAVDDPETAAALAGHRPRPWAPGERDLLVRLSPRTIEGRRVRQV